MPAVEPLPTLQELTNAYQGALVAERDFADTHEGSAHDHWAGLGAVMWRRIAERDRDEFRALYFNGAKGARLDDYIEGHFPGKSRVFDQRGEGIAVLERSSASAGGGTFWQGTRIAVGGEGSNPVRYYLVKQDTVCGASVTNIHVAIQGDETGPGSRIRVDEGDRAILRVEDPLWDNGWTVRSLTCEDGTLREKDDEARSRITAELFEERFGYESFIIKKMKEAGAAVVVLFRSDFLGEANDHGLNRVYVGDPSYESPASLLRACRLALPGCVMAGAGNQALAMTTALLSVDIVIRFWSMPENFDMQSAEENARAAAVGYFDTRENPFVWDLTGLRGAIQQAVEDTQSIEITTSLAAPTLATLFSTHPLPRFLTAPGMVGVSLLPPA